jgi:hypothetical protein
MTHIDQFVIQIYESVLFNQMSVYGKQVNQKRRKKIFFLNILMYLVKTCTKYIYYIEVLSCDL